MAGQDMVFVTFLLQAKEKARLGNNRAQLSGFQQSALSLHRDALNPCKVLEHLRTPLEDYQSDFCLDIAKINQSQN